MEDFKEIERINKEQKRVTGSDNMRVLKSSGIQYTVKNSGTIILFRVPGKPAVDFYPTTSKWKLVGPKPQLIFGNATAFLIWYAKQQAPVTSTSDEYVYTDWYQVKSYAILQEKTIHPTKGGWVLR